MYTNIGGKIKAVAKVAAWLGIIASVVSGITMMSAGNLYSYGIDFGGLGVIGGILVIVVGSVIAWLSSLALYGFGELIERTAEIAENTRR